MLMRDVNFLNLSKSTKINFIQVFHLDVIPKSRDIFLKNLETSTWYAYLGKKSNNKEFLGSLS
jgi:hypothetical protein